jgi:anti-sigma factor RsiW
VIGRTHHVDDDRLLESYLSNGDGAPLESAAAAHLAECAACRARYHQVARVFDEVRLAADADTDAIFTPERLREQQQQILLRVEHLHRSARVISFPRRTVHHIAGGARRVGPRWLAAAAAAGVFVGVAVGGRLWDTGVIRQTQPMRVASSGSPGTHVAPPSGVLMSAAGAGSEVFDDDAFLRELEFALERPHTRELVAFDVLTPHVLEVGNQVR